MVVVRWEKRVRLLAAAAAVPLQAGVAAVHHTRAPPPLETVPTIPSLAGPWLRHNPPACLTL